MPRTLRIEYEGAVYHVMSRGDRREAIFREVSLGSGRYNAVVVDGSSARIDATVRLLRQGLRCNEFAVPQPCQKYQFLYVARVLKLIPGSTLDFRVQHENTSPFARNFIVPIQGRRDWPFRSRRAGNPRPGGSRPRWLTFAIKF